MSRAIQRELRDAWLSGLYVGGYRPWCEVSIRRGYLKRHYDGHWWTATWTPIEDFTVLPGVRQVETTAAYDQNGMQTCTVEIANVYMREVAGILGQNYHVREAGWFSPWRAYVAPKRVGISRMSHGQKVTANQWERVLGEASEVLVKQGYGPYWIRTFSGLIDSARGVAKPTSLSITARDFGQLLTDAHLFGWNIDPKYRDPITFVARDYVQRRERSADAFKRKEAKEHRKRSIIIDDLTDIVVYACRWAGFPREACRIQKAGTNIREPVQFGRSEFLWDLIKKVQDVTGYTFWMQAPVAAFPMGRPTLRRSNAAYVPDSPVEEIRDDALLTGLEWTYDDEALAGIIRVRGKDDDEIGMTLGGDKLRRVMAVYRPPWHVPRPPYGHSGDARLIKHVTHTEPLYNTRKKCAVAARMIALQEALASTTANVEIPAHPGLELDDVIGLTDGSSGINTRALIARLQSTFSNPGGRQPATWKQTLGVALLDTPNVVNCVDDLGEALRAPDLDLVDGGAKFGAFGTFGASVGGRDDG